MTIRMNRMPKTSGLVVSLLRNSGRMVVAEMIGAKSAGDGAHFEPALEGPPVVSESDLR